MIDEILINDGLGEVRVALIAGGRVREVLIEGPGRSSVSGDIFLGRVERVVPGLEAAFVDVGLERDGFLPAREAALAPRAPTDDRRPTISACVHEGESLLVQATAEPVGDKGARLTTRLTLPGRTLIHTPGQSRIAISRRIVDRDERARIEQIMEALAEAEEGFVVRTVAAGEAAEVLEAEAERLRAHWASIAMDRADAPVPSTLYRELGAVARALRDHADEGVGRVLFDTAEALAEGKRYCADHIPALAERLELFTGSGALFDLHDTEADIEAALEPRVGLPSGGNIVIESTEALTAIDVNSGSYADAPNRDEVALRANLEAAAEAGRQIGLRAIAGLIVIDFIQLRERSGMEQVMAELEAALAHDRSSPRIAGPTEFGLAEITRRRQRPSLAAALTEPCPHCGGGHIRRLDAIVAHILRQAEREAATAPGRGLEMTVAPEVADLLEADDDALLAALEARIGATVALEDDTSFERDRFEVRVPG